MHDNSTSGLHFITLCLVTDIIPVKSQNLSSKVEAEAVLCVNKIPFPHSRLLTSRMDARPTLTPEVIAGHINHTAGCSSAPLSSDLLCHNTSYKESQSLFAAEVSSELC